MLFEIFDKVSTTEYASGLSGALVQFKGLLAALALVLENKSGLPFDFMRGSLLQSFAVFSCCVLLLRSLVAFLLRYLS